MNTTTTTSPSPSMDNYLKIAEEMEPGKVRVFHNAVREEYQRLLGTDTNQASPNYSRLLIWLSNQNLTPAHD